MSEAAYTRAVIERFAKAVAAYDAKHHRKRWIDDETILAALRGHAVCFANAHRIQVVLSHRDLGFGLKVYRRARGLRRRPGRATALPLVSVHGRRSHAA